MQREWNAIRRQVINFDFERSTVAVIGSICATSGDSARSCHMFGLSPDLHIGDVIAMIIFDREMPSDMRDIDRSALTHLRNFSHNEPVYIAEESPDGRFVTTLFRVIHYDEERAGGGWG